MNTIILENCIIYRHKKIEEILNILTEEHENKVNKEFQEINTIFLSSKDN